MGQKLSATSTKSCIITELAHLNPKMFWLLSFLTNLSGGCKRFSFNIVNKEFMMTSILRDAEVSECGNYLLITPQKDCRDNLLYFTDIGSLKDGPRGPLALHQIVDKFEADYEACIFYCHNSYN